MHAMQLLPALLPALPRIPVEPFQLTSFALSLLLVSAAFTSAWCTMHGLLGALAGP
jgi:hypothetical protein